MHLIQNINPVLEFARNFQTRHLMYKTVLGRSDVSIQHLQLLYPAEHMLSNLPNITSFGCSTKYINHPNLMPNLSTTIKGRNAHA